MVGIFGNESMTGKKDPPTQYASHDYEKGTLSLENEGLSSGRKEGTPKSGDYWLCLTGKTLFKCFHWYIVARYLPGT